MAYSELIANSWTRFFEKDEAHFSFDAEKGVFQLNYGLGDSCAISSLRYTIFIKEDGFLMRATIPGIKAKSKTMTNTALLLTYINDGLRYGNFEMDRNDGEITYKIAHMVPDNCVMEYEYCDKCIIIAMMMVKKYADALVTTMLGYNDDPLAAYEKAMEEDE